MISFCEKLTQSVCEIDFDETALDLSRRFVEIGLEYRNLTLVDTEGRAVDLPPVPKAETLTWTAATATR